MDIKIEIHHIHIPETKQKQKTLIFKKKPIMHYRK